jgi:hypothetical protein
MKKGASLAAGALSGTGRSPARGVNQTFAVIFSIAISAFRKPTL